MVMAANHMRANNEYLLGAILTSFTDNSFVTHCFPVKIYMFCNWCGCSHDVLFIKWKSCLEKLRVTSGPW